MESRSSRFLTRALAIFLLTASLSLEGSSALGSMSSIAVSYGENGPVFCALAPNDSHLVRCFGADASIVYGAPPRLPMVALTAGDSFVCGLLLVSSQPYCWGSNFYVQMGVPQPMEEGAAYSHISAGDHHLCGIRRLNRSLRSRISLIDCWGYNMTSSLKFPGEVASITAGSLFNCGLFARNRTAFCWGDETGSSIIASTPKNPRFRSISAGGYHVCGILENYRVFCWGDVVSAPVYPMISVVGGRFHACGIKTADREVLCWGFHLPNGVPPPRNARLHEIAAGDYFTCGVLASSSAVPVCWGITGSIPMAAAAASPPHHCCSGFLPPNSTARNASFLQLPFFVLELVLGVVLVSTICLLCCLCARFKPRRCSCSRSRSFRKETVKVRPDADELRIRRARMFTFGELKKATDGFREESQVGKGSFSCVFRGVLKDGTVVAVKRAAAAAKKPTEFYTEFDLLSRLNHAHLLSLLGFCEEGGERLLVYEFMAHGSLYRHLHGNEPGLKERLSWVRRATIAVQAARGIEYLHGYACPPVIHRDIKSSNILIDEERNARVADFGLSLLGPADGSAPLSELPAGTLGYLDPEYYRLHYLTTKSDVYSFGVLLLEILSGRKAIDLQFEEGNIVEWAVPLIKAGNVAGILDPILSPPADEEALKQIATIACKCVRMRGRDRPSMDKVTTALERALALLMGSPCNDQPILPTEVVLGSSRLHKKASQRSSEADAIDTDDQRCEFRAPSWITFPSLTSSQRRKSSASEEGDGDAVGIGEGRSLRCLEEEIGPASPHEDLFLQHNF